MESYQSFSYGDITILEFDALESTNSYVLQHPQWSRDKLSLVVAKTQTAGRGQRENTFYSSDRLGLWATLVVAVENLNNPFRVNRAIALAIAECVQKNAVSSDVRIKWPNDILVDGKKICGILLELFDKGGWFIAAGFGVNLLHKAQDFPAEISSLATSLVMACGVQVEPMIFAEEVMLEFKKVMALDEHAVHERYRDLLMGVGVQATIGQQVGSFVGVDDCGRAILEHDGARTVHLSGPLRFSA